MDMFDKLIRDLINTQDNVTHFNEKGPDYEEDVRLLRQRRTVCIAELRELWDEMIEAGKLLLSMDALDTFEDCGCDDCKAIRRARAVFAKAEKEL